MKRSKGLAAESPQRAAMRAERQRAVAEVKERDRVCQAVGLVPAKIQCRGPLNGHEIIKRSAWRLGFLEPVNMLAMCNRHNDWVEEEPLWAAALGLSVPAHEMARVGIPVALEEAEGLRIAARAGVPEFPAWFAWGEQALVALRDPRFREAVRPHGDD